MKNEWFTSQNVYHPTILLS